MIRNSLVGHFSFFYFRGDIDNANFYVIVQRENHFKTELESTLGGDDFIAQKTVPTVITALDNHVIILGEIVLTIVTVGLVD